MTGLVSQGSQNLALGLANTAASQLDEAFARAPSLFGQGNFLFQFLEPLGEELPLGFLLGQRQSFLLVRCGGLGPHPGCDSLSV
jgi:hypothetical protein